MVHTIMMMMTHQQQSTTKHPTQQEQEGAVETTVRHNNGMTTSQKTTSTLPFQLEVLLKKSKQSTSESFGPPVVEPEITEKKNHLQEETIDAEDVDIIVTCPKLGAENEAQLAR